MTELLWVYCYQMKMKLQNYFLMQLKFTLTQLKNFKSIEVLELETCIRFEKDNYLSWLLGRLIGDPENDQQLWSSTCMKNASRNLDIARLLWKHNM